jgi:hypothetical protein
MTFVGTEDDVPQHIYDSMPDRVKMKVKKQERKTIEPSYRDKNPKWTQRPKGFVTYE